MSGVIDLSRLGRLLLDRMSRLRLFARTKITLFVILLVLPFGYSAISNVVIQRTLSFASASAEKFDSIFSNIRTFSARLSLSDELVSPFDLIDVIAVQRRLENLPLPDPQVIEYFISFHRFLIGMGYSYVRPDMYYEGRVFPLAISGSDLQANIENSPFSMVLVNTHRTVTSPTELLVSLDIVGLGSNTQAKILSLINITDLIHDAANVGFQLSVSDNEILFLGNPGEQVHRTQIQSKVLPLSYVTVHSSTLWGYPFYRVLLLAYSAALFLVLVDVSAFSRRISQTNTRNLLFYRQRVAGGGTLRAFATEYFLYLFFTLRASKKWYNTLVLQWLNSGGDIPIQELDALLLSRRLPGEATYWVIYCNPETKIHRSTGGISLLPVLEESSFSCTIAWTRNLYNDQLRNKIESCFQGEGGIGNPYQEIIRLPASFMEAKEAFQQRDNEAGHRLIFFADLPVIQWESFYFPLEVEANLLNSIRVGNVERFSSILWDLYEQNNQLSARSERMRQAFINT